MAEENPATHRAVTMGEAKRAVDAAIAALGLPKHRLSGRTVSFEDLARMSVIVITVHGWQPNGKAGIIKDSAPRDVIVDFAGAGVVG